MMVIFAVTLIVFVLATLGFALGLLVQGKCIRGTCGSEDIIAPDGSVIRCLTCPNRHKHKPGECHDDTHQEVAGDR